MKFAQKYLDRYRDKEPEWQDEARNLLLAELIQVLENPMHAIDVVQDAGNVVAVHDNSLTETELAGFLYRAAGYQSSDREWSSRQVARILLAEYDIRRK